MFKKFNIGLAILVFILSILWIITDDFEPTVQIALSLMSVAFLSFGIEKIKDGMTRVGYLYIFVSLISLIAAFSSI